jgi:hypothetical protein
VRAIPRFGLMLAFVSTLALMSVSAATTAYAAPQNGAIRATDYNTYQEYHSLKACAVYCWEWHTKVATEIRRNQGYNTISALWIDCSDTGGVGTGITVTWCGRAGDSTSSYLDVGENWTLSWTYKGLTYTAGCWQRIHLYPSGSVNNILSGCAWQSLVNQ